MSRPETEANAQRYMRRVYREELELGGSEHNSRIVAALIGAERYPGLSRERAFELLDAIIQPRTTKVTP